MLKTAALASKKDAIYRPATSYRRCSNCRYFNSDSRTCDVVEGSIQPDHVSNHWEARKEKKASVLRRELQPDQSKREASRTVEKTSQLSQDQQFGIFMLNLEYLEAEYCAGMDRVEFSDPAFKEFAQEIMDDERSHIELHKEKLGAAAVDQPDLDIQGALTAVARMAGLVGEDEIWDPSNEINFFLGSVLIKDAVVMAYVGAVQQISDERLLYDVSGILATEAYHMGMARSLLYLAGPGAREAYATLVEAKNKLGIYNKEQPISVDGKANFVPSDESGRVLMYPPREVLNIVMLKEGATEGGFFPSGMRGGIEGLL